MRYIKKQNNARRRAEAEARKEARNQRSTEEQLAIIATRPGASMREVHRLTSGKLWGMNAGKKMA